MGSQDTLIKHLESQGATVKKTKKGIMIYGPPPIKGTFTIHNTPSDHRALANDMAALRRIGLTHPLDNKPLTLNPVEGYGQTVLAPVSRAKMKLGREVLYTAGWPLEVTTTLLTPHMSGATAEKILYQLGYRHHPEGKKRGKAKVWVGDEEIARLHEEVMKHRPDVDVKLREDAFDHGTPPSLGLEPKTDDCAHESWEAADEDGKTGRVCTDCGKHLPDLEFHCTICKSNTHDALGHAHVDDHQGEEPERIDYIDERDSWAVDMRDLLGDYVYNQVQAQLKPLRAVGMDYEIRVWRKR